MVLLNDLKAIWKEKNSDILAALHSVGESGWWILGKSVSQFEESLASIVGAKYAVGCANGMDAIEIGLRALGIQTGDKVLTTPLSAFATTLAILRIGAVPVFVDTDSRGGIDLDKCEGLLAADVQIKALVPVHLYGLALNLAQLKKIKEKFKIKIVEDCAQSILAERDGLLSGAVGDLAATSFYPTKNLGAMGDGGAIWTQDASLQEKCRALRDYGQTEKYKHSVLGLNSRLDEVHAAVLNKAFLPELRRWTLRRRQIADAYLEGIKNENIRLLTGELNHSVWHLFPLFVLAKRDGLMGFLNAQGVQSAIHYPELIPAQKAMENVHYERGGDLENAQLVCEQELSIPIHPYLTDEEVKKVIKAINSWNP